MFAGYKSLSLAGSDFLRSLVINPYVRGLVFLRLRVLNRYVFGVRFPTFGG